MTVLMAVSCSPRQDEQQYANRAEKILAEINNPESDYVVVISHRGDWRNYPENSIPAIESVIRMGVDMRYNRKYSGSSARQDDRPHDQRKGSCKRHHL